MKRTFLVCLLASSFALSGCGDGGDARSDAPDAPPDAFSCPVTSAPTTPPTSASSCDPLRQTGCATDEKCTWRADVRMSQCVPAGTIPVGCACSTGAGYDDCASGSYCHDGICKLICDPVGGNPMCSAGDFCTRHSDLFNTGPANPIVAGVCDRECDPLADNDFDGDGAQFTKSPTCAATAGCYGYPSGGQAPRTAFTCAKLGEPTAIHRSPAPVSPVFGIFTNACAQGYIPLFFESYAVRTVICAALCQPQNCYAGNCGTNDENRLGAAPHRCATSDRLGSFDTSPGGEHCQYLWSFEIDRQTGALRRSPHSDTVGVCFDHSKWVYDSNDNFQLDSGDLPLPACASLGLIGTHDPQDLDQPTVYWGASDAALGCVDTATAGIQ